ncbi:MAG: biotin synthase BioB, partial [Muribaculaceae bacterium]|nr:biotin synthase BioB [Muribaculaceae bacterium]
CSIINARSGLCPENCKWCAQSSHYSTGCETYGLVSADTAMTMAKECAAHGIRRFSFVASGRAVKGRTLEAMCEMLSDIRQNAGVSVCASLGLLDTDGLARLKKAGVRRYHCNLETAPSHFSTLCTTHTLNDKLATIDAAHSLGMEVCSGGIIGMGETPAQRAEFAVFLRRARPVSIPINVLCPIPGTPLADTPLISEDEIVLTAALFRMIHPKVQIRFAGGRQRLSREAQIRCMRAGVNGAIVGDLLTTIGSTVAEDKKLVGEAGFSVGYQTDSL